MTKLVRIHCLGSMNICEEIHDNPSSICGDITVWQANIAWVKTVFWNLIESLFSCREAVYKTFSCVGFRVSFGAVSKRTWCIPVTGIRTVRSTKWPATAASTVVCRSALRSACPKKVKGKYGLQSFPKKIIPYNHYQEKANMECLSVLSCARVSL